MKIQKRAEVNLPTDPLEASVPALPAIADDKSFGNDGKVIHSLSARWDAARAIDFQATTGKIIAAGIIHKRAASDGITESNKFYLALTRYDTNGGVDKSFGTSGNGVVEYKLPGDLQPAAVKVTTDGILVAATYTSASASDSDIALLRFSSEGTFDATFGVKQLTFAPNRSDVAKALAIDAAGNVYLAGDALDPAATRASYSGSSMALMRLKPGTDRSLTLDSTFDGDGKVTLGDGRDSSGRTKFGTSGNSVTSAIAIDKAGRPVLVGYVYNGSHTDFALARLDTSGAFDPTFGGTGAVAFDFGASQDDRAEAVVLQEDGKILVAGSTVVDRRPRFAMVRFLASGALDTSFGSNGRVVTSFDVDAYATGIALAQGNIIVTGYALKGNNYEFAGAKYLPDGQLSSKSTVSFGNSLTSIARASLPLTDGGVILAGETYTGPNQFDFSLAKMK